MSAYDNMKKVDSYERFRRSNEMLLKERIRQSQLWRTAEPITDADIARENALVIKRLKVWWGIDLAKELNQLQAKARVTKGDMVDEVRTGRVGVVDRILFDSVDSSVSVRFGSETELFSLEEFNEYSSKGGRTRWFIA
jgi:hypothetical protein